MEKSLNIEYLSEAPTVCNADSRRAVGEMLSTLGDKWSLRVICSLAASDGGRARFSELERKIEGISQRMLSMTLKNLERDGIIIREVFPEVPMRVEYRLTKLGTSLTNPIKALVGWIVDNSVEISQSRAKFDALVVSRKSVSTRN